MPIAERVMVRMAMPYQLLGEHPNEAFDAPVSLLYVTAVLEVVLRHDSGTGLVLRLHSYPPSDDHAGYWAAPNLQFRVVNEVELSPEPAEVINRIDSYIGANVKKIAGAMKTFAESFGLREVQLERVREHPLIELKPSINQPTMHSIFATVRYRVVGLDEGSKRNLLDPEGRFGFVVLPLDEQSASITTGTDPLTGESCRYFLGRPLISGLNQVLGHPRLIQALIASAIDVRDLATRRTQKGLIAAADIAGYGNALDVNFKSLLADPDELRSHYRRRVLEVLETTLTATGTTHVQSAGDGFVAGYPGDRTSEECGDTVRRVLENWTRTIRTISLDVNPLLDDMNLQPLGSRMALGWGDYSWGRINGMGSFFPAFDGGVIVTTARMEQALSQGMYAKTLRLADDTCVEMEVRGHYLAIASELASLEPALSEFLASLNWTEVGRADLSAKSTTIKDAAVFQWKSVSGPASA